LCLIFFFFLFFELACNGITITENFFVSI